RHLPAHSPWNKCGWLERSPAPGKKRNSPGTKAYNKRATRRWLDKVLDRRWLRRDQPPNVLDRHLDERSIIEALRRTCADCRNKSAPRQGGALITSAQ